MVTAKSLQLLDQNSNNISPLVNIETLYYEKTNDNGLVYRNQVFKHFPVYVSYNDEQTASFYVDDNKTNKEFTLCTDIDNYNASIIEKYNYKKTVDVSSILSLYEIDSHILNDETKIKNSADSKDIIISTITQSRLSNTDYYKLDITNYNLTNILDNYALESQLYAVNQLLSTKIDNNLLYDSSNLEEAMKHRNQYKIIDTIGGIEAGTDVSTLVGKTYSEILDEIITPIKYPSISDTTIQLSKIPNEIKITSAILNRAIADDGDTNKNMLVTFNYEFSKLSFSEFEVFDESQQQPSIINNITIKNSEQSSAAIDTSTTSITHHQLVTIELSLDTASTEIPIGYLTCNLNRDASLIAATNSVGTSANMPKNIITNNTNVNIILNKTDKSIETKTCKLSQISDGNSYRLTTYVDIKYPIYYGTDISNLHVQYIKSGLRYNIIRTYWQPENKFYVGVPLIIVKQIKNSEPTTDNTTTTGNTASTQTALSSNDEQSYNKDDTTNAETDSTTYENTDGNYKPIDEDTINVDDSSTNYEIDDDTTLNANIWAPKLYKILQLGKWQPCNDWIVTGYSDNTLQGFRLYTIIGTNTGATKDVQFIIDTTKYNKI